MATANLLQTSVSGGTQNALSLQGDGVFFPKASTTSRLALTLGTTDKGFIVYDTTDNNIYFWNGAAWESIPGSGDAGANGSVQYNDNGIVSGATNFTYNKATGLVTLASATITGDLTARNWFLTGGSLPGVGNGNPFAYRIGGGGLGIGAATETGTTAPIVFYCGAGGVEQYRIAPLGVNTWSDGAGGIRMILNSTGLGVGVTPSVGDGSGAFKADGTGTLTANSRAGLDVRELVSGNSAGIILGAMTTENTGVIGTRTASGNIAFQTYNGGAWGERMRIDNVGNVLVGKTATNSLTLGNEVRQNGEIFSNQASTNNVATTYHVYSTGAAAYRFYVGLGGTVFATNTVISAISDARLKENVQDIDVGLAAILSLKPRKFDWKSGKGKDIKGDRGFIAQEFETVFPNLIDEWKDPAPEGEAPYKSVRADLIPVLVKAIQELTARVKTLESR
jgi:hypothetical protein